MKKKNIFIISGIIILLVILGNLFSKITLVKNLELRFYDIRSRFVTDNAIFGKKFNHADTKIVIVALDDYSKKELIKNASENLGPWPWHRDVWNDVVSFIEKGQPKAVMFDMVFENLNENSWNDRRFAQILRKYDNIILGTYLDNPKTKNNIFTNSIYINPNDNLPTSQPLNVIINNKKLDNNITYYENAPVNDIYTEYNTMGVVNKVLDTDKKIRKTQPIFKLIKNDQTYYMPSLAFAGFLKYMGKTEDIVIKNKKLFYKDRVIPLNIDGTINLNRHKYRRAYTYIPISKILLNKGELTDLQPDFFKDKLVIIGKTSITDTMDLSSTIDPFYTSPEANAVALDNFINDTRISDKATRKFVSEIPIIVQILITIIACAIVAFVCWIPKNPLIVFLNGFSLILLYLIFCFWMFINPSVRVWIPIIMPLYYLTAISGIILVYKFYQEVIKRIHIMNVFGRFVSPKLISKVIQKPANTVLKNTKKRITVLSCSVKDIANLCEKYNAEKLIDNINDLFQEIVNIVFENNGIVDKFNGDSIIAYWSEISGPENNEIMAVKTALKIKNKIDELKIVNAKENKIIFDLKIGINTGEVILGLAGTDKFMNYTALGGAVNIASRLESICTTCNRDILISESTYKAVKDKIIVLEVGKIPVLKEEQMEVYEPIGLVDESKN